MRKPLWFDAKHIYDIGRRTERVIADAQIAELQAQLDEQIALLGQYRDVLRATPCYCDVRLGPSWNCTRCQTLSLTPSQAETKLRNKHYQECIEVVEKTSAYMDLGTTRTAPVYKDMLLRRLQALIKKEVV